MTPEQNAQVEVLLHNSDTPTPIKDLLSLLLASRDNLADSSARVQYLEGLVSAILSDTDTCRLQTLAYMPSACPRVPHLVEVGHPTEYPIPDELKGVLYQGSQELGLQLLTKMEAGALLRGIRVGISKDQERILPLILMLSIGQQIRMQQISK